MALYSLLQDSPEISEAEQDAIDRNMAKIVDDGRKSNLMIETRLGEQRFKDWARSQLDQMQAVAKMLDQSVAQPIYQKALQVMGKRLEHGEQALSAQVLSDTVAANGSWHFGHALATKYAAAHAVHQLAADTAQYFQQTVTESLQAQQHLEQQPQVDFKTYVARYR